jgi:predicted nucleic acid-binding protein
MIVILDASAAIEVVLKRERNNIFRDVMNSAEKIITSDFFMIEVANVL